MRSVCARGFLVHYDFSMVARFRVSTVCEQAWILAPSGALLPATIALLLANNEAALTPSLFLMVFSRHWCIEGEAFELVRGAFDFRTLLPEIGAHGFIG